MSYNYVHNLINLNSVLPLNVLLLRIQIFFNILFFSSELFKIYYTALIIIFVLINLICWNDSDVIEAIYGSGYCDPTRALLIAFVYKALWPTLSTWVFQRRLFPQCHHTPILPPPRTSQKKERKEEEQLNHNKQLLAAYKIRDIQSRKSGWEGWHGPESGWRIWGSIQAEV